MAISLNAGLITAVVGMLGILFGAAAGPVINHRLNLKLARKDLLFKRKLEYFEKIAEVLERNLRMYRNALGDAQNGGKSSEIITRLKSERKNFLLMASPLYFDIQKISERIKNFVDTEKKLFDCFSKLPPLRKNKDSALFGFNELLEELNLAGRRVLKEMKRELER